MNIDRIKHLIDVVAEESIEELSITDREGSIRVVRATEETSAEPASRATAQGHEPAAGFDSTKLSVPPEAPKPAPQRASAATQVTAPMVGTFYRSANKDGEPLVEVGLLVEIGTPLCVIEAMKIMNEIESDRAGTVKQVLCETGQAVERGQALFVIE